MYYEKVVSQQWNYKNYDEEVLEHYDEEISKYHDE